MSRPNDPAALAGYWSGIQSALHGRLLSVREYLRHPSSGFTAENYFRDLLRQYLPSRYAVESGFVVNATGDRSDFLDVLIVDCLHIPALSAETHFKVFPAEAVVGAIEITSAPKSSVKRSGIERKLGKLEDDILKLAKLREIAKEREYIDTVIVPTSNGVTLKDVTVSYSLSPRSFLITCGDEWAKGETYERHLLESMTGAAKHSQHVWVNAVLSMQHGMFHFKPHTQFTCERTKENALLEFVLFVNNAISEFRTSRIDLRRYRPTLPLQPKERDETGG